MMSVLLLPARRRLPEEHVLKEVLRVDKLLFKVTVEASSLVAWATTATS